MRILIFCILPCFLWAQDISEKQRLIATLDADQTTEVKSKTYIDIAWEYMMEESDSALFYTEKALKLSKQNNYILGEAIALESKGLYHEIVSGNYDLASQYYFEGIALCEEHNLDYATSIYHSVGVMFHTSDNYEKGLEYYTIAYERAKKEGDAILQKKCLINMGSIHSSLEDYEKGEALLLESLTLNVRRDLDYSTYANLGNLNIRLKKYEAAVPFLEKSIEQHPDNSDSEWHLMYYVEAKTALKDSVGMAPFIERVKAEINKTVILRGKSLLTKTLSNYYEAFGDYKTALKYQQDYFTMFEELKEKQRDQTVYDLETNYQTELTQRELEKKDANQRLLFWILGFVGLLLLLMTFFFYKNRKKNMLLAKQKVLLEASIDEKNILLKETHHRVKNSFQMVSSLLYFQSETMEDKEAQLAIREAQNRVRSMVLIHQKLYNKDQLVGVNTQEYFNDLTKDIFESHQFTKKPIGYSLDVAPLVLDVETITPIGLILNELITNVLKHAFKEVTDASNMHITFGKKDDQLVLSVADNGVGMTSEISESSFGIKLMKALAKKLKATLHFAPSPKEGTLATLQITRYNLL